MSGKIHELPNELLDHVVGYLDQVDLGRLGLVSRALYDRCIPLFYKDITLKYMTTRRTVNYIDDPLMDENHEQCQSNLSNILTTLANNATLASHVQSITHTCQIVSSAASTNLQREDPWGVSSLNGRLLASLESACTKMMNVRALTIISGQYHIAQGLVCGLQVNSLEKLTIQDSSRRVGCDWGYSDIFRGQFMMVRRDEPSPLPNWFDNNDGPISNHDPVLPFQPASYQPCRRHILETIAMYHGESIHELELRGFIGGPALWTERRSRGYLAHLLGSNWQRDTCCLPPLRRLQRLKKLTMGFRLATYFERVDRDEEIMEFWRSSASAESTALVTVGEEPTPYSWPWLLQRTYEPSQIAQRLADFVGHFVNLTAKEQEGGVHVVGKLCMKSSEARFDVDVWLGRMNDGREHILQWTPPTEDLDSKRLTEI